MNTEFAGKRVLVTGGGSGIGRVVAEMFAADGAQVLVADLAEDAASEVAGGIEASGGTAAATRVDVTDPESTRRMVEIVVDRFGGLDFAVNSAGVGAGRAKTVEFGLDDWHRVIAVNLTGVWLSMKYELPVMLAAGAGVIVNLASVAGVIGFPGHCAYSASKHGVIGLTRTAALEYARAGIRVNAVCPAFTRTPMVDAMLAQKPEIEPKLEAAIPTGRFGRPEEIAASILHLCSDSAAFINGHSLVLDGGLTVG